MPGFLIQYNRRTGAHEVTSFTEDRGYQEAIKARMRLEKDREDMDVEIVSLMGDSLETIKRTHSRYFQTDDQPAVA
jgi:hypothetical protein